MQEGCLAGQDSGELSILRAPSLCKREQAALLYFLWPIRLLLTYLSKCYNLVLPQTACLCLG